MCIGNSADDSFRAEELTFLAAAVRQKMHGYRPQSHDNGRIAWMVLEPEAIGALPRFTICRIEPCIMVQIEEADERRFVGVASLEDAIAIAERAVCQSSARRNVHLTSQAVH